MVAANGDLKDHPDQVNSKPHDAWMVKVKLANAGDANATIEITGESGGKLAPLADICFRMPSSETPRIQEGHELIGHMLCALVEAEMYPRDAG